LRGLGCEDMQGYLFSKPVPPEQAMLCFRGFHTSDPCNKP